MRSLAVLTSAAVFLVLAAAAPGSSSERSALERAKPKVKRGPRGPQGPPGKTGPPGPAGPIGAAGPAPPLMAGAPPAADCDAAAEAGRMKYEAASDTLYVCDGTAWHAH